MAKWECKSIKGFTETPKELLIVLNRIEEPLNKK